MLVYPPKTYLKSGLARSFGSCLARLDEARTGWARVGTLLHQLVQVNLSLHATEMIEVLLLASYS